MIVLVEEAAAPVVRLPEPSTVQPCDECRLAVVWKFLGQGPTGGSLWRKYCDMHKRRLDRDCRAGGFTLPNWIRI